MRRRLIDLRHLRSSSSLSLNALSPPSMKAVEVALARATAVPPLSANGQVSAASGPSHGAALVRVLESFGEATGRGLGPAAVARLFSDAAGVLSNAHVHDVTRIMHAAEAAYKCTFSSLCAEYKGEAEADNWSSAGPPLNHLTASYATFLARAAPVVGAASVESAADPLIEGILKVGAWPQREVIFALLDVSISCRHPAAAARLARAMPVLYSPQWASNIKPYEALVASILRARAAPPDSLQDIVERATHVATTFAWSDADVADAGTAHAPLMSAARALGEEPYNAQEALSSIIDFICDVTPDVAAEGALNSHVPSAPSPGGGDPHMRRSNADVAMISERLLLALRFVTACPDIDTDGVIYRRTLQVTMELAALRSWYSSRQAALAAALGRGTRADVSRVFSNLASEQVKKSPARKLQREAPGSDGSYIIFWRSGAMGTSEAVNAAAASQLFRLLKNAEADTIHGKPDACKDLSMHSEAVISELEAMGVPPSIDVGVNFLRIAFLIADPNLIIRLISAMGSGVYGSDSANRLSESSANRLMVMFDNALLGASPLQRPLASRTATAMLDIVQDAGVTISIQFLVRLAKNSSESWAASRTGPCPHCMPSITGSTESVLTRSQKTALVSQKAAPPAAHFSARSFLSVNISSIDGSQDAYGGRHRGDVARLASAPLPRTTPSCAIPDVSPGSPLGPSLFIERLTRLDIISGLPSASVVEMAKVASRAGCGRETWAVWRVLRERATAGDVDAAAALADRGFLLHLLRTLCNGALLLPAWEIFLALTKGHSGPLPTLSALSELASSAETQPPPLSKSSHKKSDDSSTNSIMPAMKLAPSPSPASVESLLTDVSVRLAGVLPAASMTLPSWRGIPLVIPRAYGGGLSGVVLNFPSVLLEVPDSLGTLLAPDATGVEAATASTALGNAVYQALERLSVARAISLLGDSPHAATLKALSSGLAPDVPILKGLRAHGNHGGAVRVHAPPEDKKYAPAAGHMLIALHLTVPTELLAQPGLRLVPGDAAFCAIITAAAASLVDSKLLSFRVPRQRGTPPSNNWWNCHVRALPEEGEAPVSGVRCLPKTWTVEVTPAQRDIIISGLRARYAVALGESARGETKD
jgi:hypothetical protein